MSVLSSTIVNGLPGAIVGGFVGHQFLRGPLGADPIWLPAAAGVVIGGLAGGIYGAVREARKKESQRALQRLAQQRGGQFSAEADSELSAKLARNFSLHGAVISDVLHRDGPGVRVAVGQLAIATQSRRGSDHETRWSSQTAAYFMADVRFPGFTLQPEGLGLKLLSSISGIEDIDFPSHMEFSRHYQLSAVHSESTRRLFEAALLEHLASRPGLHIQAAADGVLVYRPGTPLGAEQIEGFIAESAEIFRLLEASARKLQQAKEAGMVPKTDARAEAEKMPGTFGKMVREGLVTRADVDAFLRQAPPREVAANIRRYCEATAPAMALVVGALFFLVGGLIAFAFALRGEAGGVVLGVLFFAVGGAVLFFFGRIRLRLGRVLRHGELGVGRIETIESTGWSGPGGEVWRASVRFQAAGQTVQAKSSISGVAVERAQRLAAAKKPATVLYDPANPQRFLLVDALRTVSPEFEE